MAFHPDYMESISIEKIFHLRVSLWLESTGVKSYQWLHFVSKFISDGLKHLSQKWKKLFKSWKSY